MFKLVMFLEFCIVATAGVAHSTSGVPVDRQHHAVNRRNEVESVWTWSNATAKPFPDGYTRTYLQHRNGNLITDGLFVYQYDAFDRLIRKHLPLIQTNCLFILILFFCSRRVGFGQEARGL